MDQKKNHGMWLRQTETGQKRESGWLLSLIMALFASEVLLLTIEELTKPGTLYTPWAMLLAAGGVCILYGIAIRQQKLTWFYPAFLLLLLLLVLCCGKLILNGFSLFWNQMGDAWTAVSGFVLPELEASTEPICLMLFSVFLGSSIALLCCGIVSIEKRVMAVVLPVLLFVGMVFFREDRTFRYIIPTLLLAVGFLLCSGKKGEMKPFTAAVSRWIPVACCSVLFLFLSFMPDMENWTAGIGESVQEKLHVSRYETAYTTLPEGDFSDYTENDDAKQTALVVNMEQPEELHLRGFTGAVYEKDTWSALDPKILAENEDLLYWLNQNGWNPHTQFSQAVSQNEEESEDSAKQTITVQNLNACSKYLYVPYNLCEGEYLEAGQISSDGVTSDGNRTYLYSILSGGTEVISKTLSNLQEPGDEKSQEYLRAENAYREFVYRYYLTIPQDVKDQLLPHWEEAAAVYGNVEELTAQQTQECAKAFLEKCFSEDGEQTEILLPLDVAKGSSYQYATVTTLTLRYFGIPARYVEGYIITEEMAEKAEEENNIKVDSSCGGAWVEVYQDGIGWIPMDVMPGLEEQTQNTDQDDEEGDSPKQRPPKGKELEEEPEDILEEPEPQGGYAVTIRKMISWTALFILLLLSLILLLLVLRRKVILNRRQKRWDAEGINDASAWIFADTVKILERLGFYRGKGSMWELLKPVKDRFGEAYAEELETMITINARAMFSSRALEEEHRETAKSFYAATLQHLKENAKWYQKLWMQWILCLY